MKQTLVGDSVSLPSATDLRAAVGRFIDWLTAYGAFSQDPHDFWAWNPGRRAKVFYYRHSILGAPAVLPLVIADTFLPSSRKLVRRAQRYPIADAHYAMAFFALWNAEHDSRWLQSGRQFLSALIQSRSPGPYFAWGLPFDWESSAATYPAGTPFITMTPYAYEAFEAGFQATGNSEYATVMQSAAEFASSLEETEIEPGITAAAYSPLDHRQVVNANAYRAFMLTAAGRRFNREDWLDAAARNVRYVLRSQSADGAWPYATDGYADFIDNIHTCFVLKNLIKVWRVTRDPALLDAIRNGYDYYKGHLIDSGGLPVPFARKPRVTLYRRELYDYAEGINLAILAHDFDTDAKFILRRLGRDLVDRWSLPDGHFLTREMLIGSNSVPYHRWGQAQAFRALVECWASQD